MDTAEITIRLGVAALASAALGLNRDLHGKPTGVRTLALVGLASALIVIAVGHGEDAVSRVMQGIVTGIGFLGAGAIIRGTGEETVRGLTTAASIWLAAATGIACGLANWALVLGSCTLGVLILITSPVERVLHNRRKTDKLDIKPETR
jgi:putative Mg2+ transporter-C (MgtC) family protein